MTSEKKLFKGLKIVFSLGLVFIFVAAACVAVVMVMFNIPSVLEKIQGTPLALGPFGDQTKEIMGSPIVMGSLIVSLVLYGLLFYWTRNFFNNLELDHIFVDKNVISAKKISLLLVVLSVTTRLPDIFVAVEGVETSKLFVDVTLVLLALVVWALSKILEKANQIAAENDMTI